MQDNIPSTSVHVGEPGIAAKNPGGKGRNGEVDFMRFLLAIGILFFHARYFWRVKLPPFLHGNFGVDFFFLLSGLLMARSIAAGRANDTFAYLKRKIASFYPVFAASTLIAGVCYCIARRLSFSESITQIVLDVYEFLLVDSSGLTAFTRFNGVGWYLSSMVIAMAMLHPLAAKTRKWFFPVGSVLLASFCYGVLFQNKGGITAGWAWTGFCSYRLLRAIAGISLGVFIFEMADRTRQTVTATSSGRRLFLGARVVLFLLFATILYNPPLDVMRQMDKIAGFICILLFAHYLFLAFSDLAEAQLFGSGRFNWCGPASLYLYLNHTCVFHLLNRDFVRHSGMPTWKLFALLFGGAIASCLVCAVLAALFRRLARTAISLLVADVKTARNTGEIPS